MSVGASRGLGKRLRALEEERGPRDRTRGRFIMVLMVFMHIRKRCFWAGSVAQAIEFLPSKCEALSSNPSTEKKKKKIFLSQESFVFWKTVILILLEQDSLLSSAQNWYNKYKNV
jgi:hypothetical protein